MSETTTTQERRSALDEFAQSVGQPPAVVPQAVYAPPVELQHGAIAVAVHRDEAKIFTRLKALAAAAGDDWYYRWPVTNKKKGTTEFVEGPSIKLANDLARIYGNNDVDVRVQDFGNTWLFHARFIDLESGFSMTRPFQQRKSGGTMGDDAERRLDIAFQIGSSKAIRNVVVNALQTYADFALREAKEAILDKIGKNIEDYRRRTVERCQARTDLARVEAVVGRAAKDWLVPDIAKVIAMMTAVVDGMASLDETFPPLKADRPTSELDQFASAPVPPPPGPGAEAGAAASPHAPQAAPAPDNLADIRADAIDIVLRAARTGNDVEDRLAYVDGIIIPGIELLPPAFKNQLLVTATKVAKDELGPTAARKYLEALP